MQPVAVFVRDRGCVLERVVGRGQVAAFAEFLVAVESDQDDRLADVVAAFAEHWHARDEVELGRTCWDAVVRAATSSGRVSCALSANIMIIFVLERRSEIGLGRALGATKNQIRTQFRAESILLAVIAASPAVLAGAVATAVYASSKGWAVVIPWHCEPCERERQRCLQLLL